MHRVNDDSQLEEQLLMLSGHETFYLHDLSDADFRSMLVFVAVVELGGIRQAASMLNVSDASISMTLGRFRSGSYAPLFTREGRRLEPTSVGLSLAKELGNCFYLINRIIRHAGAVPDKSCL